MPETQPFVNGLQRHSAWTTLSIGCGGGSDVLRVSLDDVDASGGYRAIRATCKGRHLQVEFRPGEQLSVPGLGHASSDQIAVECGKPERGAVSEQELRRHTPSGADLVEPTFEPTRLSCVADGSSMDKKQSLNRWIRALRGTA